MSDEKEEKEPLFGICLLRSSEKLIGLVEESKSSDKSCTYKI